MIDVITLTPTVASRRDSGRPSAWSNFAYGVVYQLAKTRREFSVNDIWALLAQEPADTRAISGVLRGACNRGWIKNTNRRVPNEWRGHHNVAVWESCIQNQ